MLDVEALARSTALIVREQMEPLIAENAALRGHVASLVERLEALEQRPAIVPEKGADGKDADPEVIRAMVVEAVAAHISGLPAPEKGDPGVGIIKAELRKGVLELTLSDGTVIDAGPVPGGRDGADCDMDAARAYLAELVDEAVAALPAPEKGADGKDADPEVIRAMVAEAVDAHISALPAPEKGEDGKDGLGLANALIDRDGCLIVTFTDGRDKNLGQVVGKDGADGKDGETFGLDDFDMVPMGDGRSFDFRFTRGDVRHSFEFSFPVMIYRGVWAEDRSYQEGDAVTWGGSLWIASRAAPGKPDTADSGWRLAVKKGRDGKDAGQ